MVKSFEERILKEREKLKATKEQLLSKVRESSYGPKTKGVLEKAVEFESFGQVGFALFDCPPAIERGRGATVIDADGKEYVDLLAGMSVSNIGLCHPEVVEVIKEQAGKLIHYFDLPNLPRVELSERLTKIAPGNFPKKVAYAVTGSEAVEVGMRLSRWYTGKPFILTAYGEYHGRTMGAMSLTGRGTLWAYHYPVLPADSGIFFFPYAYCYRCLFGREYSNCDLQCVRYVDELFQSKEFPFRDPKRDITNVAAIIIEPMQSSAGYIIPPDEFLAGLEKICRKYDILFVADEIQSGMGRTGKMWGVEHSGTTPDMIMVAKSIGDGLPLSMVVGREEIMDSWGPAGHLGTYAGAPLVCAVANKVLEVMERDRILEETTKKGEYFLEGLLDLAKRHPIVGQVNGKGLYLGIEFVRDRKNKVPADEETSFLQNECIKEGVIPQKSGYYYNRFNIIPPLVITKGEIDKVLRVFDIVFGRAEKKFGIGD